MNSNILIRCLIAMLLLAQTGKISSAQEDHDAMIAKVENGLSGPHRIKGEPTWSIGERMAHYGVPGMSLAVIKDHQVIWTKAYGVKNLESKEPVTTDTLFQCASISKPVSSSAALRLVEQGTLSMDDDVNQHLKSWKLPDNEFTKDQKVTLKHLVSHTGGLTVHGFLGYTIDEEVPTLVELLNGSKPANSPAIFVDKTPGESFRYSGGGYCVLQQMMIDQTNENFPTIMKDQVLQPLGMNKSTFDQPLPSSRLHEAASGYLPDGSPATGGRYTHPEMAAAGLWSTSEELAQFLIELQLAYHGKSDKVLTRNMARRMIDESLGIFVRPNGDEVYFGHGGWNQGFSSDTRAHRDRGYGVVVLTNGNHPPFIDEVINSVAHTYQWQGAIEHTPLPITDEICDAIVGRYNKRSELVTIFAENSKLFLQQFGSQPQEMVRVAKNKFVRREAPHAVCFSQNEETDQWQFAFQLPGEKDDELVVIGTKLGSDEKLPIEWLEEGNLEHATKAYLAAMETSPDQRSLQEDYLNNLGYQLIEEKRMDFATRVFHINTSLYPNSFNTWDSLGEAYLLSGRNELAISYYEKSLELNPDNVGATQAIEKMKNKK